MSDVFIGAKLAAPGSARQLYSRVSPVALFCVERYFLKSRLFVRIITKLKTEPVEHLDEAID